MIYSEFFFLMKEGVLEGTLGALFSNKSECNQGVHSGRCSLIKDGALVGALAVLHSNNRVCSRAFTVFSNKGRCTQGIAL